MHRLAIIAILFILKTECVFFDKGDKLVTNILYMRRCSIVDNEKSTIKINMNFRKYNRTHFALSSNCTTLDAFDHTYAFEMELRKWSDGGWKHNFLHLKREDACQSAYLYLGPVWMAVIKAGHAKPECPIPKGYYWIEDLYLDLTSVPIIIQPGRFYGIVYVTKKGVLATCLEAEFEFSKSYL